MSGLKNRRAGRPPLRSRHHRAAWVSVALVIGVLVAGGTAGAATAPPVRPTAASGTLAALSGNSIEVQNPTSGQVTVNWSPTTTFSQTLTVPASTLAVGDCVTATGAAPKSTGKSTAKSKTTSVTATTISISHPGASGTCSAFGAGGGAAAGGFGAGGFGGGFRGAGGEGGGSGSFRPPSGTFPKGASPGARAGAFGGVAFGKVTSITGGVVMVVGTRAQFTPAPKGKSTSKSSSKTAKPKLVTTKSKVTYSASTTFSETMSASSAALAVGKCVTALGPASDTGAITATTITVRPAPASGCVSFTGGFGGGGFGRGAGGGGTTTA
jgi:hypothetical protein